ncbi:MAG: AAA family ATPase [Candidatus Sedimenticola endophacoides]
MQAKYALLGHQGAISFEYDTERFSEVAGLSHFKRWLEQRRKSFTGNAASLQRPKGVMLLGVQGGGKSLAAKAVAGSFSLPLLRVDFGALYDKYIGESEKNLRQALRIAETMAPCVLWMDEIEKGLAGDGNDGGVSRRLLASLLTWMAEQQGGVFIVATANDIRALPPELMRKGRLDEIFFVDLPTTGVRREIFAIHLRRRNQAPSGFDLEALAEASEGFTGAEIEQAIVASLYAANAAGERMESEHLLEELARTSPLSVVMAEEMGALRAWAEGRTVPAG